MPSDRNSSAYIQIYKFIDMHLHQKRQKRFLVCTLSLPVLPPYRNKHKVCLKQMDKITINWPHVSYCSENLLFDTSSFKSSGI